MEKEKEKIKEEDINSLVETKKKQLEHNVYDIQAKGELERKELENEIENEEDEEVKNQKLEKSEELKVTWEKKLEDEKA